MARECFLMAGGGTGGHVMPLLAVAEQLKSRGHEPYFIGTQSGFEARLVPQRGFGIEYIDIGGFQGVSALRKFKLGYQMPASVVQCVASIIRHKPKACFSLGGYVAAPPVAASVMLQVPLVVMEPNAMPGMVNRIWGRFAKKALLSFEESVPFFSRSSIEITGLPVREAFFDVAAKPRGEWLQVLITGGSQGSQTLNRALRESWPLLKASGMKVRLRHQCGRREEESLKADFAKSGLEGSVQAFVEDMPAAFADADLVISRAGAGTVSELVAAGRPSVLVPFPYASDDHQTKNAQALVKAGAAVMVTDREMNGAKVLEVVQNFVEGKLDLKAMAERARALRKPGAAARAADILENIIR